MNSHQEIEASLRDDDGSCRDVNFSRPSWDGVAELLEDLTRSFTGCSAENYDGRVIAPINADALVRAARAGHVRLLLTGGEALFNRLQVFACPGSDGMPFLEITFFPADVLPTMELAKDFVQWVKSVKSLIRASDYFVRYENASWRFGDTGPHSGVFFTSTVPL